MTDERTILPAEGRDPRSVAAVHPKRPVWVWVITIFFLLSAVWTLLSFYLILSGSIPIDPAQKAYFDQLTPLDYLSTVGVGLINIAGAITLFMLLKIARILFLCSLVLSLGITAWHATTKGWVEAIGGAGLVGAMIGYAILAIVCVYAWHLTKKGVLR